MLSVIYNPCMLSNIMLSVVMLSVVRLNVVAPKRRHEDVIRVPSITA